MDYYDEKSSLYLQNKRFFQEFLSREENGYSAKVQQMLREGGTRLIVQLSDLRAYNQETTNDFLRRPLHYFAAWQAAVKDFVRTQPSDNEEQVHGKQDTLYTIGVDGAFGRYRVSPRDLLAHHLGCMMCVEGIATRCSIVRPKVARTVHYCEATNVHSEMSYHDQTSLTGFPTSSVYPTKDAEQNPLSTEFGLSEYMDHQTLTIQEMPERAPAGLLPSSVDVVLDGDLVDSCKPGDRVQIVGIYRALPNKSQGGTSGVFRAVLIANHVRLIGHQINTSHITEKDTQNIRGIAKSQKVNCVDLLARSIAPSIHGYLEIKKSILLLLLGGVEKNLENGTHIRGDINMLLIGDPSVAKSQILRFVLNIAPLAINTTGRGASGVGLTAAVTQNRETGERQLEAGAMVLADRGVVCIDEFDKMSDIDRVAIHEVMEQQTVTIAKAGIHMSLNARCSVVAAANPKYGQYDTTLSPQFNIDLPDSLISRFDLLFIMLDNPSAELDRQIADKVLNNHRYLKKGPELDSDDEEAQATKEDEDATPVYQKYDKLLHSGMGLSRASQSLLNMAFVKKYIEFAKTNYTPILSQESCMFLGQAYAELRNKENQGEGRTMPVTARALETLIRLSSAHAKARLSKIVTPDDCKVALSLMNYALTHDAKVVDDDKEKKTSAAGGSGGDGGNDDDDIPYIPEEKESKEQIMQSPLRSTRSRTQPQQQQDDVNMDDGMDHKHTSPERTTRSRKRGHQDSMEDEPAVKSTRTSTSTPSATRIRSFQKLLSTYMSSHHKYEMNVDEVIPVVNVAGQESYSREEIELILVQLENENKVMFRDGVVHRI